MSQLAGSLPAFARRSAVTCRHSAAGAGGGVRLKDRSASRTRTSLENVPIPFSDVYGTVRSHVTAHRAGRVGHPLCGPSGRDASALSATLSTTLRLDHVNPDEDDLRSATVLRPMVDVARLRDEATRSERLAVAALPEPGEMATQHIGERRTLLMAMKPRHPPGLEGARPQAKLVAGEIRAEIDRALDPGVESLVLGGRTLLSQGRTQPKARSERARADEDDDSPRSPHDRFSFHGPPEWMNPRPPKGPLTTFPMRYRNTSLSPLTLPAADGGPVPMGPKVCGLLSCRVPERAGRGGGAAPPPPKRTYRAFTMKCARRFWPQQSSLDSRQRSLSLP